MKFENINQINTLICANAERLARLGNWPAWIGGEKSLLDRVPSGEEKNAPGFDAGLAAALGMIPVDKQDLAATLHAAYTEAAVEHVRREMAEDPTPDSQSVWWLSACSICREGGINEQAFMAQLDEFQTLIADPTARLVAATAELNKMKKKFALAGDIPFVVEDGGMQGAYLVGFDWAVQWNPAYGIFFIGTFRPSLGLEDFKFSDLKDAKGRPMSGPVHGSKQFVKAASIEELAEVVKTVRSHLGAPRK